MQRCLCGRAHCSALRTGERGLAHILVHKPVQYSTLNVGLSSGRLCRRSYSRVVAMLACPNHSCTLGASRKPPFCETSAGSTFASLVHREKQAGFSEEPRLPPCTFLTPVG